MDVATQMASASVSGADLGQVGIRMLKKAQEMEAGAAAQLLQALPSPPGVGGRIDMSA